MSEKDVVYSIQRTYIINSIYMSGKAILTCDQRIDIPTIEPLPSVQPIFYKGQPLTVIPCIELACEFLSELNLTFETNEGVTVLPIKIAPGDEYPLLNPYSAFRYVLVLPRGATGVKSCKITHKDFGVIPHNFTFGIMPPPYNYDNALSGVIMSDVSVLDGRVDDLENKVEYLTLTTKTPDLPHYNLPKGAGKQTINIEDYVLCYFTGFSYPLSEEPTIHNPKITLHGGGHDDVYTLSFNKRINAVSIDLFTGMIRVCDDNGVITHQSMLNMPNGGYETLSFENFDDIEPPFLAVTPKGAWVKSAG